MKAPGFNPGTYKVISWFENVLSNGSTWYRYTTESPFFFWVLLLNCVIAFSVNLTNFLVTKCTSPLTLQVLGNAKGAVAVVGGCAS